MLSKSVLRLVRSLDSRKGRRQEGLFVAEGPRLVGELLGHFQCHHLFATAEWLSAESQRISHVPHTEVTPAELTRLSLLQTPQQVLALMRIPEDNAPGPAQLSGLHLALDGIQDPGNLGTIIRVADWFGIEHIWCSMNTADVWNPKVVQATMGGLSRVRVHYLDLVSFLSSLPADCPVFGTSLSGQSLWSEPLSPQGVIVMGNEGNGVSREVDSLCSRRLLIPSHPTGHVTTESLNVAMATGIVLAEFRRRQALL